MSYTYDSNLFSDFYKEVYGVRPRGHEFYTASPARAQEIWDSLMAAHEAEMEAYYEAMEHGREEQEIDAWAIMSGDVVLDDPDVPFDPFTMDDDNALMEDF